jgi:hypothetical protein
LKKFFFLTLLAILTTLLAQATHETGHMLVCHANRCEPTWGFIGLVQRWDEPPLRPENWLEFQHVNGEIGWLRLSHYPQGNLNQAIFAAAGPIAGVMGAIFGLWLAYHKNSQSGLMFSLVSSLSASLYYLRNPLRPYGDEYDIAAALDLPQIAIVTIFALAFLTCLGLALRRLPNHPTRLRWLGAAFLGMIVSGVSVSLADGWVREMVNLENPFFQPVLGYSLPVLLVYLLAGLGVFKLTHHSAQWTA